MAERPSGTSITHVGTAALGCPVDPAGRRRFGKGIALATAQNTDVIPCRGWPEVRAAGNLLSHPEPLFRGATDFRRLALAERHAYWIPAVGVANRLCRRVT